MERLVSFYIRKWLGVPRCLSTVALYEKGILQLPVSSLVEEFKCNKVTTELLLAGSKDMVVSKVVPNPTKGRKCNTRTAAQEAEATLRHTEIVGNVQIGRGGLGLGLGKLVWSRAGPREKRKLVVEQVRRQEEMLRGIKAVAQAKQGQWLNCEGSPCLVLTLGTDKKTDPDDLRGLEGSYWVRRSLMYFSPRSFRAL